MSCSFIIVNKFAKCFAYVLLFDFKTPVNQLVICKVRFPPVSVFIIKF